MTLIVMFLISFLPQEINSGATQVLRNPLECARLGAHFGHIRDLTGSLVSPNC